MMKKDKEQKTVQRQKSNSMMNPIKGFADGMKKMTDSMAATLKVPMSPKHKQDDDVKANTASMVTDRTVMFADSDHMSEEEQLTKLEAFSGALKEAFLCVPKSTVKVFHRIGNIEGKVYKKVKGIFVEIDDTERSVKDSEHHAAHTDFPVVPPDEKVAEMDIVISKKMKGVSIPDYYSTTWAETTPFYANWLEASGKMDVSVGDWQEGEVQGEWCREIYQRQRIITFHFQRTTPLYKGSLNANVKHTQYCRVEGSDRCVLSMTVQMEGIPYADFFSVEVRWVATRVGSKDIQLEVGLFVNFVTSTVLAGKIRAGTKEETTKAQLSLFDAILDACSEVMDGDDDAEVADDPEEAKAIKQVEKSYRVSMFGGPRSDDVALSVKAGIQKLQQVQRLLETSRETPEQKAMIRNELAQVHFAIDKLWGVVSEGNNAYDKMIYFTPSIMACAGGFLLFVLGRWTVVQVLEQSCPVVMDDVAPTTILYQG